MVEIKTDVFTVITGVVLYSTTAGVSMTFITQPTTIDPSKLSSQNYVVVLGNSYG